MSEKDIGGTFSLLKGQTGSSRAGLCYLATVLEYLSAEIIELVGKKKCSRHLQLAIRNDEDLNRLLSGVLPRVVFCRTHNQYQRRLIIQGRNKSLFSYAILKINQLLSLPLLTLRVTPEGVSRVI